ncbi:MAG TPA: hypothetical protein PKD54_02180 [Pirellulaceae bacterium]|nr:hypothetical protein [Pirellulaceae bacterium]
MVKTSASYRYCAWVTIMMYVCWIAFGYCLSLGGGGVLAQDDLHFSDIILGFQENSRKLLGSNVLIVWSSQGHESDDWIAYRERIASSWDAIDAQLSSEAELSMSRRIRESYQKPIVLSNRALDNGQLIITDGGIRLRQWSGETSLESDPSQPLPANFPHDVSEYIFPQDEQFFGILAYDSRVSQFHMSILPVHDVGKYIRAIHLPFDISSGRESLLANLVSTPFDVLLGPPNSLGGSPLPTTIKVSGDLAHVELCSLLRSSEEGDRAYTEGYLLEAVVDMSRGYWPVSIKTSPVALFEGKLLDQFARSCWATEINVELTQSAEGFWFPHRIVVATNSVAIDQLSLLSLIQDPFTFRREGLATPVEKRGVLVPGALNKVYAISVDRILAELDADLFSLKENADLGRFYDSRTGEVRISKGIEDALELDLGTMPSLLPDSESASNSNEGPAKGGLWGRWGWLPLAVVLSILAIGLFMLMRSRGTGRRRAPVE